MRTMNLQENKPLDLHFFQREDVLKIAEELIGKKISTHFNGQTVEALIVETEAYNGVEDRACHAFGGRRTARTETMYQAGGIAYIYLCYGIHHLFNFVTSTENDPKAVLLRGVMPIGGMELVLERRKKSKFNAEIGIGPGAASQVLGFHSLQSGMSLVRTPELLITESAFNYQQLPIRELPRIGVDYAGEDAKLPYRFVWDDFQSRIS